MLARGGLMVLYETGSLYDTGGAGMVRSGRRRFDLREDRAVRLGGRRECAGNCGGSQTNRFCAVTKECHRMVDKFCRREGLAVCPRKATR